MENPGYAYSVWINKRDQSHETYTSSILWSYAYKQMNAN